jgi:hypothetical protein
MRKRLRKKLGLLPSLSRRENVDTAFRGHGQRMGAAAYRLLAQLITTGSMHGYAAMETRRNEDGTFTHRITAPAAR